MGIEKSLATLLLAARRDGDSFDHCLTIGRQELHTSTQDLLKLNLDFEIGLAESEIMRTGSDAETFIVDFLGAKQVNSLDFSSYEGADIVHDLNYPIPDELEGRFDCLVDGGSIEHIFNIPVVIENYMRLVRQDGSIFIQTTANNHFGHGFYQFSSEFFYRVFEEKNGCRVERLMLVEHEFPFFNRNQRAYGAVDPKTVKKRTLLVSKKPVMVVVHARKTAQTAAFKQFPLQSDYVSNWERSSGGGSSNDETPPRSMLAGLRRVLRRLLPVRVRTGIMVRWNGRRDRRRFLLGNPALFRRLW